MSEDLIEKFCMVDSLETYDPYDVWKIKAGYFVKRMYNENRLLALPFAVALTLFDFYLNNSIRLFYKKQEYPIVRAMAILALLERYKRTQDPRCIKYARIHAEWLLDNASVGYSGYCWGIKFRYPVSKGLIYDENTPFATITPYVLEALHELNLVKPDDKYTGAIKSIYKFLREDIRIMYEDETSMATSYGPCKDRIVINSLSYTMYCYALLGRHYLSGRDEIYAQQAAAKLFNYIIAQQGADGAWMYSVGDNSFIDCFHSCFVVKNILKAARCISLEGAENVIESGYKYIKDSFLDSRRMLFRRFSVSNKYGVVRFDLYDNAEMLGLAILIGDVELVRKLSSAINKEFIVGGDVYSQIDFANSKKNKNTLRWAVMPLMYAFSKIGHDS